MVFEKFVALDMGVPDSWADRINQNLLDAEESASLAERTYQRGLTRPGGWKIKPFKYIGCCASVGTMGALENMTDAAVEVTYEEMLRRCDLVTFSRILNYDAGGLKNDHRVYFYKSEFEGKPCYYLEHSHIEWIWVKR